jgi:hypothetical protein
LRLFVLLVLLFSTACTVFVAHSVSAILYFAVFRWWIVLNVSTRTKLQLQLLFCIVVQKRTRTKEDKRRRAQKQQFKWRGSDVVAV